MNDLETGTQGAYKLLFQEQSPFGVGTMLTDEQKAQAAALLALTLVVLLMVA